MPLTESGKRVHASMVKRYGPEKADRVFYASINKGKPGSSKWHQRREGRRMRSRR